MSRAGRRARRFVVAGLAAVFGSHLACNPPPLSDPDALGALTMIEFGTIEAAGRTRGYWMYAPSGVKAAPVVIVLHGSGGAGIDSLLGDGWLDQADRRGLVVVAPDAESLQQSRLPNVVSDPRIWNANQPYLTPSRRAVDDVALFDALLQTLARREEVDPTRVFVAGHSSGGSLAFRLAVERSERIRAVAVVAAPSWMPDPQPDVPVATLFITGTADPLYPPEGGTRNVTWLRRTTAPVRDTLAHWSAALGCATTPRALDDTIAAELFGDAVLDAGRIAAATYDCNEGGSTRMVALYLAGHGHRWPGGATPFLPEPLIGPDDPPLDATTAICDFFAYHDRE